MRCRIDKLLCACALVFILSISFGNDAVGGELPRVARIAGKAQIMAKGEWSEAKIGQRVAPGQKVRVAGGGEVGIEASGGKVTVVAKDGSVVQYDGMVDAEMTPWRSSRLGEAQAAPDAETVQQFSVDEGEIEVEVGRGEPLRVVTPLVAAGVRGTRFVMRVELDASSSLNVLEGLVAAYGRDGKKDDLGPGGIMTLDSASFVEFLRRNGINVPPGSDWRALDPAVLEALDERLAAGDGASVVYYNPVLNRMVRTAPVNGVDQEKVSRAVYVGGATLDDLLNNPNAHPLSPEWLDDDPLTQDENNFLAVNYTPPTPAPSGGARANRRRGTTAFGMATAT